MLADLDAAHRAIQPERASALYRGHSEHGVDRQGAGIVRQVLADQRGQAGLGQHIHGVVAGRPVGAQTDRGVAQQPMDRQSTRFDFQVAGRAMGDGHAVLPPAIDLFGAQVDAVRCDCLGIGQPVFVHTGHRTVITPVAKLGDLKTALGQMNEHPATQSLGSVRTFTQQVVRAGVGGMRRQAGRDSVGRSRAPAFNQSVDGRPLCRAHRISQCVPDDSTHA